LESINREIIDRENAGAAPQSKAWLAALLADTFAFRRANGALVGRDDYLAGLKDGGDRTPVGDMEITLLGKDRAFVHCVVRSGGVDYDNARLFIVEDDAWKLLAWANETLNA